MINQRTSSSFGLVVAGLLLSACASIGPEAKVTMLSDELKATKSVGRVFIASPFGAADQTGSLDKAISGTAIKAFGQRSVPGTVINTLVSGAGAPDGLTDALVAPYVASFVKALQKYDAKDPKSQPTAMDLPSAEIDGFPMPKKFDEKVLKDILAQLNSELESAKSVGSAMAAGNTTGMIDALGKSKLLSPLLVRATQSLLASADADHMLLTQVTGTEAEYNSGKKVRIMSALVNVKTGKFRFFGEIEGSQTMGIPYVLFVGNMTNKLFNSGTERDPAIAEGQPVADNDENNKTQPSSTLKIDNSQQEAMQNSDKLTDIKHKADH